MAIFTKRMKGNTWDESSLTKKYLIQGQTYNTTDFSIIGKSDAKGKVDIADSRSVDGSSTGTNWSTHWIKPTTQRSRKNITHDYDGGVAANRTDMATAITIDENLPDSYEIEISGYIFRGKAPTTADSPGGDNNGSAILSYNSNVAVYYESDSSNFSDFLSFPSETKYTIIHSGRDPIEGDTEEKWTKFVGKGVVPEFSGNNVGTKGGWQYSTGETNSNYSECLDGSRTTIQRDATLFTSNLDIFGGGLTRYFKIIIANQSGSNVKLKLAMDGPFHGGTDSADPRDVVIGFYDLKYCMYQLGNLGGPNFAETGLFRSHGDPQRIVVAKTREGIVMNEHPVVYAGNTHLMQSVYNLNPSPLNSTNYSGHVRKSLAEDSSSGKGYDSSSVKFSLPFSIENIDSSGDWALPITGGRGRAAPIGSFIQIGGEHSSYVFMLGQTGSNNYFKVKSLTLTHRFNCDTSDITATILKINHSTTTLGIGDGWTGPIGGGGTETVHSAVQPDSGKSNQTHKHFNFPDIDIQTDRSSIIVVISIANGVDDGLGLTIGHVLLSCDFSGLD